VSRRHNIAVVTSIHQPNNDVLMRFDRLYVLARGGRCVYDGRPQDLALHLNKANIECNDFQVPIEVLLKIGSKIYERTDMLVTLTTSNKSKLIDKCLKEGVRAPKGVPLRRVSFSLKHFWYLLLRTTTYTLRSQWKAMIIQFVFILSIMAIVTQLFNSYVGQPDGCFSLDENSNISCIKTEQSLRIESLLSQNLRLQFFTEVCIQFLLMVATTLRFASEVRIFLNEHNNGTD